LPLPVGFMSMEGTGMKLFCTMNFYGLIKLKAASFFMTSGESALPELISN